jgi:hypothetical protein
MKPSVGFPRMAAKYNFSFDTTSDWNNLNPDFLARYEVVVFLDTRPEDPAQRAAFQRYMEHGGAWMGFHFAGFALTPSVYPANWDWYHNTFLGAGSIRQQHLATGRRSARRRPQSSGDQTSAETFKSSPSEWYRWEKDLRQNPDIDILLSIDSTSFPLGTGPKPHEIWHSGYYPVVWTNRKYRMIYLNMGHNDIDYEHKYDTTNKTLSYTLNNPIQDRLIIDGLLWLGTEKRCPGSSPLAMTSYRRFASRSERRWHRQARHGGPQVAMRDRRIRLRPHLYRQRQRAVREQAQ